MHDIALLIGALSWPVVVLIILGVLRPEWQSILIAIRRRIETAKEVTLSPRGMTAKGVITVAAEPELQKRRIALANLVRGIGSESSLHAVARALNVEPSANILLEKNLIALAIFQQAETEDQMSRLEATVASIIEKGRRA